MEILIKKDFTRVSYFAKKALFLMFCMLPITLQADEIDTLELDEANIASSSSSPPSLTGIKEIVKPHLDTEILEDSGILG